MAEGAMVNAKVKELGIPVRGVNWVRLFVGTDAADKECLYATMGQQGDNLIVLRIDPQNGKFKQYIAPVPGSNYPISVIWASDRRLYIGAAYSGHLLRFDPKKNKIEDLGAINPPGDTFPCRIDEAPDGSLFIGCYGTAGLTRYDPKTGEFKRYGRMDEVDMYCYPLVAPDGIVASEIRMTRPHIVLLDPKTGEKKTVGPVITAGEPGKSVYLMRANDKNLYIVSSEGNYRIEGMNIRPVDQVPPAEAARLLADGSTFYFSDAEDQQYRELVIESKAAGAKRQFGLDYDAAGSSLFVVHLGPDGKIYGSSIMPLHLYRYHPQTGEVKDMGRCSPAAGEAYSMGNLDGKLYICSYPAAMLSVYDPGKPYHFGSEPNDNPRDLGPMDEHISYRPRAMLTGPLGRVWTGSYPNYGIWGGPLAWYDPKTGEKKSYRHVLQDQSVCALAWAEPVQLIVGGTSISGGSGTQPKAEEAALFLWDPVKETKVWQRAPRQGTHAITALVAAPDGMIYGIAHGRSVRGKDFREILVFDPAARKFVRHLPIPEGGAPDNSLQIGQDGKVYGVTTEAVYRIEPGTRSVEVLTNIPGRLDIPGPLVAKTLYFAVGPHLRSLELP
jgi:streptogramin lyase